MVKIKLNNEEFEISSFTRTVNFSNTQVADTATCNVLDATEEDLTTLAEETITTIEIYNDNNKIYELTNLNARIVNLTEALNNGAIDKMLNITFY